MSSKLFQSADTSEQWRKHGASVTVQSSIIPSLSLTIWTQAQRNVSKTPWKVLEGEQPFKRPLFLSWNKCTSHSFKFDLTTRPATPVIADPRPRGNGRNEKFSYLLTLIAQVHRSNSRLSVCKLATRIPRETMRYFRRRRRNKNGNWQGPLASRLHNSSDYFRGFLPMNQPLNSDHPPPISATLFPFHLFYCFE